jgi:hypothetical protein
LIRTLDPEIAGSKDDGRGLFFNGMNVKIRIPYSYNNPKVPGQVCTYLFFQVGIKYLKNTKVWC